MKLLTRSEWTLLVFILLFSAVPVLGGLIRVLELFGGPAIAPQNLRATASPVPISLHILSSAFYCVFGALQFLPDLRRRHPKAHRRLGRFLVISGILSATTALWMTHIYDIPESLQGSLLYWVRIVLGVAMIGLILWAVLAIRSRNVFQHSSAMLRAYAIGQGASTQTVLGLAWIIIAGSDATGFMRDVLMVFAWAVNLLLAEVFIWKWRNKS